ncbi:hypothetical protein OAS39_04070 [Pirellulales bacterium]|nr:hypothetical protein [Pirellulales bacterium]
MASLNSIKDLTPAARASREERHSRQIASACMQCLVVAPTDDRRQMIRDAAQTQAWDVTVCSNSTEFLRCVFRQKVALIVIDLPRDESGEYRQMRNAAEDAVRLSDALLLVSGAGASADEEIWARSLGVWSYLPHADCEHGFQHVLSAAQDAIGRREQLQSAAPT